MFYWGQYPINFLILSKSSISWPAISILPSVAYISLVRTLKVDDLPAPLTPRRAKHSPGPIPNDRFSTATTDYFFLQEPKHFLLAYTFLRPSNLMTKSPVLSFCTLAISFCTSSSRLVVGVKWSSASHRPLLQIFLHGIFSMRKSTKNQNTKWIHCISMSKRLFACAQWFGSSSSHSPF